MLYAPFHMLINPAVVSTMMLYALYHMPINPSCYIYHATAACSASQTQLVSLQEIALVVMPCVHP